MTIKSILSSSIAKLEKADIETANLDVRVLLEYVLKKDSSYFFTHPEMPLTNYQYAKFRKLINRRKKGEPIAYLTGHKEFYGYDFFVNKNVLIPRPETELLVEHAIEFINSHCEKINQPADEAISNNRLPRSPELPRNDRKKELSIIDIGTGSGCIIISIILELYKLSTFNFQLKCCASDISNKALYIARKNAKMHQVNKDIRFYNSDLFSNQKLPKKYEIIIANLPYVPMNNYRSKPEVENFSLRSKNSEINFEPKNAIFAKNNGTQIIKRFLDQAKDRVNKNGLILIEVDPRNVKELYLYTKNILDKSKVELIKDLAKLDRVIRILN